LGSHLVCLAISGASVGVTVLSGFLFSIIEKRCMKLLDRGVSAIIAPGADDRPRAGRSAAVSVAASPAPVALADDWRNDGRVVMTEGVGIGGRVALRGSDLRGVGHGSLGRGAGGCPGGDDGRPETPTDGGRAGIGDEPTDEQPLTARRTLVLEADLA
jgi:hypothetical protein